MKTKKRLLVLALAILLIVTLLTGCKSGETGKSGDKDGYTFGATYWTMNNPYFVALEAGIRAAVEANGDKLISYDPQGNQSTQISQIEDMIAQKVDLIFLNPCDYQGVRPALESAQKAGIPIIVV
ncbi:MAG TPA: sugar ABC transporter substrate-binding protein, partial [Clostridiales bacterium]|nr:sugar ABC transporter substrate-binding protein [Clostridiales bacterium]